MSKPDIKEIRALADKIAIERTFWDDMRAERRRENAWVLWESRK